VTEHELYLERFLQILFILAKGDLYLLLRDCF